MRNCSATGGSKGPSSWPSCSVRARRWTWASPTCATCSARGRALQVCRPAPSSWGQGGYHDYWLNDTNAWVVAEWQRASRAMVQRVNRGVGSTDQRALLTQAGRELLLAQSSDWSFILRAGTTTGLAPERIRRHLDRFWRLIDALEHGTDLPREWLVGVEREDGAVPGAERRRLGDALLGRFRGSDPGSAGCARGWGW